MYAWVSSLLISQLELPPPSSPLPLPTRHKSSFQSASVDASEFWILDMGYAERKGHAAEDGLSEDPGDQPRGFCRWGPPVTLRRGTDTDVIRVGSLQALS